MPEEAMRQEMTEPVTLSLLAELKSRWRVSIAALLQRAKELVLVTERQYKYLRMQMAKRGWTKEEPVPMDPERPRGLRKMAEVAYGPQLNVRQIAKEAKRPPFLIAQLIDAAERIGDTTGRVLDFRPTDVKVWA
jgi:Zn-dependent peptidase ImmA (M78 family)